MNIEVKMVRGSCFAEVKPNWSATIRVVDEVPVNKETTRLTIISEYTIQALCLIG